MPLDPRVRESIRAAVEANQQPETLATYITAWLEGLADGNESLTDRDDTARHLELLFNTVEVTLSADEEDGGSEWPS